MSQIADVLTHDERLRLEALAQAVAHHAMSPSRQPSQIVNTAREFENYISSKDADSDSDQAHD